MIKVAAFDKNESACAELIFAFHTFGVKPCMGRSNNFATDKQYSFHRLIFSWWDKMFKYDACHIFKKCARKSCCLGLQCPGDRISNYC